MFGMTDVKTSILSKANWNGNNAEKKSIISNQSMDSNSINYSTNDAINFRAQSQRPSKAGGHQSDHKKNRDLLPLSLASEFKYESNDNSARNNPFNEIIEDLENVEDDDEERKGAVLIQDSQALDQIQVTDNSGQF